MTAVVSVLTEEIKKLVGKETEPETYTIEEGHIRRFTEAVGDNNPLWRNVEYAKTTRYGTVIAPPTFLQDRAMLNLTEKVLALAPSLKTVLNVGAEVECFKPMRCGDILTTRSRLSDAYEKEGKSGKLLFLTFEVIYFDSHGDLVTKGKLTLIKR